jgi:serine/threonine-protein kinase RsbW
MADRSFRHEMVTAFGEAFNNIVIHAYKGRSDGMLEVEAELADDEMTLTLKDTGRPVDFAGLDPPDLDSMPERGMGVFMIHALVDEVVYHGGAPNVLSLTKRTARSPINEGQSKDELRPHG